MPQCPRCDAPVPETGQTCPNCGVDIGWWMSREGQVYGPYDLQTIQFCQRDGRIVDDDYVKLGRDEPWFRVSEVFGARAAAPQPATPAPPATATPATPAVTAPRKSNTLVILVVVGAVVLMGLAVLAILAAILLPVFGRAKGMAQQTACINNLKQIGTAFHIYAADNDDKLPPADSWRQALEPYLDDREVYKCPGTGEQYVSNVALGGKNINEISNPMEVPMAWDAPSAYDPEIGPHLGEFNVLYVDGHVATVDQLPGPP